MIEMKKDWDVVSMVFFDLKKDDQLGMATMQSIIDNEENKVIAEELAEEFVFAHVVNKKQYDENYYLVELELDKDELN